jgi:AraC-like DNA-binding protein
MKGGLLMSYFLKMFVPKDLGLYVTEFGHSIHKQPKTVGPWSRKIYILHLVTKGYCEFSGFRANEGQAFLISKDQLHSFTISNDYEHYWIGFDGEDVEKTFEIFHIKSDAHQLFSLTHFDFAKSLLSAVAQTLNDNNAEYGDSLVISVLTSMLPLLKSVKQSKFPGQTNYAENAQMFINSNYVHPIKMTDIANELHISEKYMYRLFMNRFNLSPQQFLLKTRMEVAKNLLEENNMSVKEIAFTVGYSSIQTFSKAFTNYYGVCPSLLKKQNCILK